MVICATPDGSDGAPIAGAQALLYSDLSAPHVARVVTDSRGAYALDNIPIGRYVLEISADGYITELFDLLVETDVTTHVYRLRAVPVIEEDGFVGGALIHAVNGGSIYSELKLEFRRGVDMPGDVVTTAWSFNGRYGVALPAGNYTVTVSGPGYITAIAYVYSYGGAVLDNQDITVSPQFDGEDSGVRIVLTWGEFPYDLDSHLVGPGMAGFQFHTYYSDKQYVYGDELVADLDLDDVTSYGPETTTIHRFVDGQYKFLVHDYTNRYYSDSEALKSSQAVVRVYSSGNELLRTFSVPTGGGPSTVWHVFSLNVRDGAYEIVPVNEMSHEPEPYLVGMDGYGYAVTAFARSAARAADPKAGEKAAGEPEAAAEAAAESGEAAEAEAEPEAATVAAAESEAEAEAAAEPEADAALETALDANGEVGYEAEAEAEPEPEAEPEADAVLGSDS
jgi:hypothetical protein